ncbi:MAG: hypothetical protein Q4F05_07905 [bacterium]|nr:hypothetical protein [bacterium]
MKSRKLIWFMALRNCFRDKKNFMILVLGISISIAIIIMGSASNNRLMDTQLETTRQITGDWHMAFLYEDETALDKIRELDGVKQVYSCFYIPDVYDETENDCFQMLAIGDNEMDHFIEISQGKYPVNQLEIVLPQWYLDKYQISELPYDICLLGEKMSIVGSFQCDYKKTSSQIPLYLSYEENKELKQYSKLQLPWGSVFASEEKNLEETETMITLVSLKEKTDVSRIESEIEKIPGVGPFPVKEAYGITEYEKQKTAWFNGELISVQNLKNAGELTTHGVYGGQKRIANIYELIIVAVTVLFLLTLINLKKKELLFQSGLLKAMGINSLELIGIGLIYMGLVMGAAAVGGVLLGFGICAISKSFQYIKIGSVIIDIGIVIVSSILSSIILMIYSLIVTPLQSIREGSSDVGAHTSSVRVSGLINHRRGFNARYSLRNMSLHKGRYVGLTLVVALLFTLFVTSLTIVSLNKMTGNGREKYEYDILIKRDNSEDAAEDPLLLTSLNQIEGVEEILAPLCYNHSIEEEASELIVKIPREKLDYVLEQKLLLANYNSYVENDYPYVMSNTGVVGCSAEELEYLKQYMVEGNIEDMYDGDKEYVLLPKYFESYENSAISMTKYNVGDTIELCLTKEGTNQLDPEFSVSKTFTIAGFVDTNPFYMSNGVSSEFSVILNAAQLQKMVPGSRDYIYMKVNDAQYKGVEEQLNKLALQNKGYSIKNAREDQFDIDINKQAEKAQQEVMALIVIGTSLIILIAIANLIFVKKMLRKDELRLLRIVGLPAKMIRRIDVYETIVWNGAGVLLGMLLSLLIMKQLELDLLYTKLTNIPWAIWAGVALSLVSISIALSMATSVYLEKQLDIE